MSGLVRIERAILSVTDKSGLEELGRALAGRGVQLLSSGGTAKYLKERGIDVTEVSDFTQAPEMLDGRLKTLHPKIHGGILSVRTNSSHHAQMKTQNYVPIDLVVVNLYAFEKAAADPKLKEHDVIENIDIGGPALLRSAAKNHEFVLPIVEPEQYVELLEELKQHDGATTLVFRKKAAQRVFERTAAYDAAIAEYFNRASSEIPKRRTLALESKWPMRYGENPHQSAGFYLPSHLQGKTILEKVLQGKQLSYNNLLDIHGALDLISEFADATNAVAILKHTNPCGVGVSNANLREAYERALSCDPVSAFGGIVVASKRIDKATAEKCSEIFTEIVVAPGFDEDALAILEKKKNLRLLEVNLSALKSAMVGYDIRRTVDGFLVQARDVVIEDVRRARVVTKRSPSKDELQALDLGWKVAKHVKSNAIVLATATQTVGIGAGQMSRVDSSKIAAIKAGRDRTQGIALASDAFFPFRDSIDEVAGVGVKAIVQPGGSMRDEEVISAANEHGIAMVFTGVRHFKH